MRHLPRRPVPSTRTRYATRIPVFPNIARWLGGPTWKTRTGKPMAGGAGEVLRELGHMPRQETHPIKALALLFVLGAVSLINERVRFSLVCCRVVGRPDINGFPAPSFGSPAQKPGQKRFCPGFSSSHRQDLAIRICRCLPRLIGRKPDGTELPPGVISPHPSRVATTSTGIRAYWAEAPARGAVTRSSAGRRPHTRSLGMGWF